jgi:hypothetical protein
MRRANFLHSQLSLSRYPLFAKPAHAKMYLHTTVTLLGVWWDFFLVRFQHGPSARRSETALPGLQIFRACRQDWKFLALQLLRTRLGR